ncbi:hypothetical protein IFR05_009001 [Cadophora sp. M221]|nr:hypothetical protein IFR05_009001 [Cadophora sp. M221]
MLISQAISQDHRYLDECYDKLKAASTTEDKLKRRNILVWNLARHAISEELTVHPAMEEYLGEKWEELARTDFQHHQAVKRDLSKLHSLSPSDAQFPSLLEQIMDNLHRHIEHEKETDIPLLESAISKADSERIALGFMRTKKLVPTKSYRGASKSSPLTEGLVGLLAAPIRELRGLVESFPEEEEMGSEEVDWSGMV